MTSRKQGNGGDGYAAIHPGNVEIAFDAARGRLAIFIDVTGAALAAAEPSGSGKSRLLACTAGFVAVPLAHLPGLKLSLTATLPLAPDAPEPPPDPPSDLAPHPEADRDARRSGSRRRPHP